MDWSASSLERSMTLLGAAAYRLTLDTGGQPLFSGALPPGSCAGNEAERPAAHTIRCGTGAGSGLAEAKITDLAEGMGRLFLSPAAGSNRPNPRSPAVPAAPGLRGSDLERLAGQTRIAELDWLPGSEGLLGRPCGRPAGPAEMRGLLGEAYPAWIYQARRVMESGQSYAWNHALHGGESPLSVRHSLVCDGPGRVIGALKPVRPAEELDYETGMQLEMLEKLPVGVLFIDLDFRVRWANRLAYRQGSLSWRNHYGERCHELLFGAARPCPGCPTARCLLEGEGSSGEISTPSGKTRLITAMPVYGKDGGRLGAVQITTDVSDIANERQQVLDKLRWRERRLSRFQEVLEGLHSIPALNGGSFARGAKAVAGVALESMGLDSCRLWLKKKRGFSSAASRGAGSAGGPAPRLGAGAARALAAYEPELREARKLTMQISGAGGSLPKLGEAYGKIGVGAALLCPVKFGGELLGLFAFEKKQAHDWSLEEQNFALALADFTALQIVRDRLRDSRRKLDSLLANLPGAAFRIKCSEAKFSFDFVSRGCSELIGYSPAELLRPDFDIRSIICPEDLSFYEASHLSLKPENGERGVAAQGGGAWKNGREIIFRCACKDNQVRWLWARLRSVFSRQAGAVVHEGFALDITDRYKLREMEAAAKARSEFLASVSHEIRTPMNAILGMARMAMKTGLNPKQYDCVHKIQSAAGALLGIINSILDVSSIESGKLSLEKAPFRPDGVMAGLNALFGPRCREKGLGLRLDVAGDVPYELVGDAARLAKILYVLLDNAVKFTEQGEIGVDCRLEGEAPAGGIRLRFVVEDSGIGLPEEERDQVFAPFFQGDDARRRKCGGAGLGLAVASKLVEAMDGEMTMAGCRGRGARVSFTCLLEQSGLEDPAQSDLRRRAAALAAFASPPRVLVYGKKCRETEHLSGLLTGYRLELRQEERPPDLLMRLREMAEQGNPCRLLVLSRDGRDLELERLLRSVKSPFMSAAPRVLLLAPDSAAPEECAGFDCVDAVLLRPLVRSLFVGTVLDLLDAGRPGGLAGEPEAGRAAPAESSGPTGETAAAQTEFIFHGQEILLVEDNEINQEIALDLLEEAGLKGTVAGNGLEALRVIERRGPGNAFALILMDLQMPEMDGFAATRAIRALPEYRAVPILAMTAHAFEEERERCRQAGMNGHVSKPVDAFVFYRLLRENLYGGRV